MLFLAKAELNQVPPFTPEQSKEIMVQGWENAINYQKQGKILAQGAFAGRKGGCVIWDVDSFEELHSLISQSPIFPFLDMEIIPLISIENCMENTKRVLNAKITQKIM
ncbi:muconolactone Delta-isomerase [Desulfosporosinus youngiae]|uniref:Muconolactone delta-isomerase n=1 Tax=Desulfosporosinus youngiae DSM 17734 TaxID=768710 RepID=H5Y285_9FIRM|nr:muconolactone Delta-isomerase family protein [Desulfosporosinus youngiae]EHQ88433.1 muconolactone delta-isomerase [Desulfosporosinus youngiae DSM 17734]